MAIDLHTATATLAPHGLTLNVKTAKVTLDESWNPYCQASLVCSLPDDLDRALVDLRKYDLRVEVVLRTEYNDGITIAELSSLGSSMSDLTAVLAGKTLRALTSRFTTRWNRVADRKPFSRRFLLTVTDRLFDEKAHTLRLELASYDDYVNGDALVASGPLDPGTRSVREICRQVLSRYGFPLAGDSLDAVVVEQEATVWQPGVSAWDYLNAILEPASLWLWADELGVFHVSERMATKPGVVRLSATSTITNLTDRMATDPDVFFDAVVVEYRWKDATGKMQTAYDVAGAQPARSVLSERREARYPGPGAAAGILKRARGRGRVLEVDAVSDYRVTPGQAATIIPPGGVAQSGYVASVTWQYPGAEMSVPTRRLIDTPPTAYIFGPAGLSYTEVPAGISYNEFDWELV